MALTVAPERVPLEPDAHGALRVAGTRIPLDTVIAAFNQGASPEEIALSYPSLELADIYAIIAYYLRHRPTVDAYLEAQDRLAQEARERYGVNETSRQIRERLLARRLAD
ncbi:MAG: DUF433 domain-containing protein [Truepera sp.]|nr:DUF433 domain-containing protein [Truepera sp.]